MPFLPPEVDFWSHCLNVIEVHSPHRGMSYYDAFHINPVLPSLEWRTDV
jgi:hypothetical protein